MSTSFTTDTPRLSDATVTRIRAAAHQFVMAGGSLFPNEHDEDRDQHIGNIRAMVSKNTANEAFSRCLKRAVPDHATHEQLWSAAISMASEDADAAFLFGAYVGLEFAHLRPATGGAK